MEQVAGKRVNIAYIVVAILMALMMGLSASGKFTQNPGAVRVIHEVAGVPMSFLPVLGALELAGGLGLLAGIYRPQLGVAAAIGLVLYFVGAMLAHVHVGDWAGLSAPIVPLLMSIGSLVLALKRVRPA